MSLVVAILFLVLALWRAGIDWQATIGNGYAFRLASIEDVLAQSAPGLHKVMVTGWAESGLLWDPVGRYLMSVPLALLLAIIALIFWLVRPRRGRGRG